MARLANPVIDSDEELPDVSVLLAPSATRTHDLPSPSRRTREHESQKAPMPVTGSGSPRRQRPLKLVHVNSLLLPLAGGFRRDNGVDAEGSHGDITGMDKKREQQQSTSVKLIASKDRHASGRSRASPRKIRPGFYFSDEDISDEDSMSDFIVDDSASDLELPAPRSPRKGVNSLARRPNLPAKSTSKPPAIDLTSPEKAHPMSARPITPPEAASRKDALGEECPGRLRL